MKCVRCGSHAINQNHHGRHPGEDLDLCDVCYWRKRANGFKEKNENYKGETLLESTDAVRCKTQQSQRMQYDIEYHTYLSYVAKKALEKMVDIIELNPKKHVVIIPYKIFNFPILDIRKKEIKNFLEKHTDIECSYNSERFILTLNPE